MSDKQAIRVQIFGKVQGVWYRNWTDETAQALGLHGWVRNRLDGSVEAMFVGSGAAIDEMVTACHDGPRLARVDRIDRR